MRENPILPLRPAITPQTRNRGRLFGHEPRLKALLASLGTHVAPQNLSAPAELLEASEWGLAFEMLCDALYELNASLFPGEVVEIEALGRVIKAINADRGLPDRGVWARLRHLAADDLP